MNAPIKSKKVFVLGSFVVDLIQRVPKLPSPGETIMASSFAQGSGGKGSNQAIGAAKCGAEVVFATKIGKDTLASIGLDAWKSCGMNTSYIFESEKEPCGSALIMVDEHTSQNLISVAPGACLTLTIDEVDEFLSSIVPGDIFLTQLETNLEVVWYGLEKAHTAGAITVLNPAPANTIPDRVWPFIDYITPNETEASVLSGVSVSDVNGAKVAAHKLLKHGVGKGVIITLGSNGVIAITHNEDLYTPPYKVKTIDTTGAGDAFNGALACAMAEGQRLDSSMLFASACAAISVTRTGTSCSIPFRDELDEFLTN